MKAETRQCLENLRAILVDAGSSMDSVLKATCYLGDISMVSWVMRMWIDGAATRARSSSRACASAVPPAPDALALAALRSLARARAMFCLTARVVDGC